MAKQRKASAEANGVAKAPAAATTSRQPRQGNGNATDRDVLRAAVEAAQSGIDEAKAEAADLEVKARECVAQAKATYRAALMTYRDACQRDGVPCEFRAGRSANVSSRVSFNVSKVKGGLQVVVRGRPDTEEVIPASKLRVSINKCAYQYVDTHVGPREEVGNKGGSLANRLRAAYRGEAR